MGAERWPRAGTKAQATAFPAQCCHLLEAGSPNGREAVETFFDISRGPLDFKLILYTLFPSCKTHNLKRLLQSSRCRLTAVWLLRSVRLPKRCLKKSDPLSSCSCSPARVSVCQNADPNRNSRLRPL